MALCALTLSSDSKGHLAAAGAQIALWPINTLVGALPPQPAQSLLHGLVTTVATMGGKEAMQGFLSPQSAHW